MSKGKGLQPRSATHREQKARIEGSDPGFPLPRSTGRLPGRRSPPCQRTGAERLVLAETQEEPPPRGLQPTQRERGDAAGFSQCDEESLAQVRVVAAGGA